MKESFYSFTPVLRDKLLKELNKNGIVIKVLDWYVDGLGSCVSFARCNLPDHGWLI